MNTVSRGSSRSVARSMALLAFPCAVAVQMLVMSTLSAWAQKQEIVLTAQEKPIFDQIKTLRSLPDDVRARTTKDIALEIRALPPSENKLQLANYLANRATEGDFGHDTLQEVATTLAGALQQAPPEAKAASFERRIRRARATGALRACADNFGHAAVQGCHCEAGRH